MKSANYELFISPNNSLGQFAIHLIDIFYLNYQTKITDTIKIQTKIYFLSSFKLFYQINYKTNLDNGLISKNIYSF